MAMVIYVANLSLDGYIEDASGSFDRTEPSDEVFTFITDLVRPRGYLAVWTTSLRDDGRMGDRTRPGCAVGTGGRLRGRFDPDSVRDLKASAASDPTVGGAALAAAAFDAGLIEECDLFVSPVLVACVFRTSSESNRPAASPRSPHAG
jgi:hypothetical protein